MVPSEIPCEGGLSAVLEGKEGGRVKLEIDP